MASAQTSANSSQVSVQQQKANDQASQKSYYQQLIKESDAIMEPNSLQTAAQYIKLGGAPEEVVQNFKNGYVGFAQMASLTCNWIKKISDKKKSEGQNGEKKRKLNDEKEDGIFELTMNDSPDEFDFLNRMAFEKFDPQKLMGIFTKGGSGPPKWIDQLGQDIRGRQLIYKLSAKHQNSLVLNFAVQKILQAGHEDEVAGAVASLSAFFSVFHRVLGRRLIEFVKVDQKEISPIIKEIHEGMQGQLHTYLHTAHVLLETTNYPNTWRYQRLFQELQQNTAKEQGPIVWQMDCLFCPSTFNTDPYKAVLLSSKVIQFKKEDFQVTRDSIVELQKLYEESESLGPELLRKPILIQTLIDIAFNPQNQGDDEKLQESILQLLAITASCLSTQQGQSIQKDSTQVEKTRHALARARTIGYQIMKTPNSFQEDSLKEVIESPIATICLLHYINQLVSDQTWYFDARCVKSMPLIALVLQMCILEQTRLHQLVLDIIREALKAMGNTKSELARQVIDVVVTLLCQGQVKMVIDFSKQNLEQFVDPSIVRYFIFQLLDCCAPPYSVEFASYIIHLMQASSLKRNRDCLRGSKQAELLEEFVDNCPNMEGQLGPRAQNFFSELSMKLY